MCLKYVAVLVDAVCLNYELTITSHIASTSGRCELLLCTVSLYLRLLCVMCHDREPC